MPKDTPNMQNPTDKGRIVRRNLSNMVAPLLIALSIISISFAQHKVLLEAYESGEKLYTNSQYEQARELFSKVFSQSSDMDLRAKALYMKALCSYKMKLYDSAVREFEDFVNIFRDHDLVFKARMWSADAHFEMGDYLNAAQDFANAMISPDSRLSKTASEALENTLWGYLPIDLFPTLLDRVDRSVEGFVGRFWLKRLIHDGEYARAFREGQKLLNRIYDIESRNRIQEELALVDKYLREHLVVAVLVPREGEFAQFGEEVYRGVELAFANSGKRIDLQVLNSGGDALKTAKEMDKLLRSSNPLCIMGPITSNETVAAGALAGTYKVPLITPTASRDGIAEISPYIFQLIASPVKASAYLAKMIMSEISPDSMDTFAILAPEDDLGRACALAFIQEVTNAGGTIIGAKFFRQGTVDFSKLLAEIKEPILQYYDTHWRWFDTTDATLYKCDADSGCRVKPREEWLVHIDGFFLPIYFDDIGIILPQIPFMYIDSKPLGTNGWVVNDLKKDKKLFRYMEGALIIPDDFYVCRENEKWDEFERLYKKRYGNAPGRLAALGYDAASIVLNGIENGAVTQEMMRDFLSGIHDFAGVAGPVEFNEDGANTKATILMFQKGELKRAR